MTPARPAGSPSSDGVVLLTEVPAVDRILADHAGVLADDAEGYRNHTLRLMNLCAALSPAELELEAFEKLGIAAAFHDLGIWTDGTWDYLPPSIRRANDYLAAIDRSEWEAEIAAIILEHHKITPYRGGAGPLVEIFRRADWIEVTWGVLRFGLDRDFVHALHDRWPDAGFHRLLVRQTLRRWKRHPLSPLPMFRL